MNKNRLEAFADGVFAISITLLVLNIRIPGAEVHTNAELIQTLKKAWPNILTYIFTFLVVGVFWVAHLRICFFIKKVSHFLLWSNIFYLMTVAFIPFPAAILAAHHLFPSAIILYCGVLFFCGAEHMVTLLYLRRNPEYAEAAIMSEEYDRLLVLASVGPGCYLTAALLSLISPLVSFFFILVPLVFYIMMITHLRPERHL
jgi:uncharacterized membrane protein